MGKESGEKKLYHAGSTHQKNLNSIKNGFKKKNREERVDEEYLIGRLGGS